MPHACGDADFFTGPSALDASTSQSFTLWAIRENGALIGVIELRHEELASSNVGYWLGHPHRGRGIMTEAVDLLIEYAFDEQGLAVQRKHWEAMVDNCASALVAKHNGFAFEGTNRDALPLRTERRTAWQAMLLASDSPEPVDGWPL